MGRKVILLLLVILGFSIYGSKKETKLIREYYRLLETPELHLEAFNITDRKISIEEFKEKYKDIYSISVIDIQKTGDSYQVTLLMKNRDKTFKVIKEKITMAVDEWDLSYIESISPLNGKVDLSDNYLSVLEYYENMERPENLKRAYDTMDRSYSFDKFSSWYKYDRAYTDVILLEEDSNRVKVDVKFTENYNGRREYYRYEVTFNFDNGKILNTSSKTLDIEPDYYSFYGYIDKVLVGNLKKEEEERSFINNYLRYQKVDFEELFRIYYFSSYQNAVEEFFKNDTSYTNQFIDTLLWKTNSKNYIFTDRDKTIFSTLLGLAINNGGDINRRVWEQGMMPVYPIIMAAALNNFSIVEKLLEKEADIQEGLLYYALNSNRYDLFELLLERGANINETLYLPNSIGIGYDSYRSNLVYYAVQRNSIDWVKYLLNKGANPNIINQEFLGHDQYSLSIKCNPTAYALFKGQMEILNLLLGSGADMPQGKISFKLSRPMKFNFYDFLDYNIDPLGHKDFYNYDPKPGVIINIYSEGKSTYLETTKTDIYQAAIRNEDFETIELYKSNNREPLNIFTKEKFDL